MRNDIGGRASARCCIRCRCRCGCGGSPCRMDAARLATVASTSRGDVHLSHAMIGPSGLAITVTQPQWPVTIAYARGTPTVSRDALEATSRTSPQERRRVQDSRVFAPGRATLQATAPRTSRRERALCAEMQQGMFHPQALGLRGSRACVDRARSSACELPPTQNPRFGRTPDHTHPMRSQSDHERPAGKIELSFFACATSRPRALRVARPLARRRHSGTSRGPRSLRPET